MGDGILGSGSSSKGITKNNISHLHSQRFLSEFIVKGMKTLRSFVEYLRMTEQNETNELVSQVVKIRDVASHKLEFLQVSDLQSIAQSLRWLNEHIEMELDTLTLYDQLTPSFYDIKFVDSMVFIDFIQRNIQNLNEGKVKKWLCKHFPTLQLQGVTYEGCNEMINTYRETHSLPQNLQFTQQDIVALRTLYDEFAACNC